MGASPDLRLRLETAVKQQQANAGPAVKAASRSNKQAAAAVAPHKPTIQLKMDFSNFGKSS